MIMELSGFSPDAVEEALQLGRTERDSRGDVIELFGVMLAPTLHRMEVDERVLFSCCPLVAHTVPRLIDKGITLFLDGKYDMVTNVLVRSFPKGQSVEILDSRTFETAYGQMGDVKDLEHVTRYFYRNKHRFNIRNFESGGQLGHIQLSVDTPEDMAAFESIVENMEKPHWDHGLDDILEINSAINGRGNR